MALTTTTLSAAATASQTSVTVTAATNFSAGLFILVDGNEMMQIARNYVSGTTVPVLRGQYGTNQAAHPATAAVTLFGLSSDFTAVVAGGPAIPYGTIRPVLVQSYSATGTMTLPPPGCDLRVILNGTGAITLTIPVPTRDLEGCELTIVSNGAAAHVPTFTSGVGGAGSNYDAFTFNSTGLLALKAVAAGGYWNLIAAPGITGTVTNITCGVA